MIEFTVKLCHSIVPIYIGLCRALGRTPNDDQNSPLFLRLFPPPSVPPKTDESQYDSSRDMNESYIFVTRDLTNSFPKKQTLPNLQKLIPRSFSSLSPNQTWSSGLNCHETNDNLSICGIKNVNRGSFQSQISTYSHLNESINETRYFFFKFGSSFAKQSNRLKPNASGDSYQNQKSDVSLELLLRLLSLAKKLLNKEVLQTLDEIAFSVFTVSPYLLYHSL